MKADVIAAIITLWSFIGGTCFAATASECVPAHRRGGITWWVACVICGPVALMIGSVMACGRER